MTRYFVTYFPYTNDISSVCYVVGETEKYYRIKDVREKGDNTLLIHKKSLYLRGSDIHYYEMEEKEVRRKIRRQRNIIFCEKRTREYMFEIVKELQECEDPFLRAVGYCCHPACWWYQGCPEIKSCNENTNKVSDKIIETYRLLNDLPLRTKQQEADEASERR